MLPLFQAHVAEVKRERAAAHGSLLEKTHNKGDVDLGDRHVTAARLVTQKPTRGAAAEHRVQLELTNAGPSAIAPIPMTWLNTVRRAIDAEGERYSVLLENIAVTSQKPGSLVRVAGLLSKGLPASEPQGPLLLELPMETPVVRIERDQPAVLA